MHCVAATATDAHKAGFKTVIAEDLVGDNYMKTPKEIAVGLHVFAEVPQDVSIIPSQALLDLMPG